MSCFHSYRINTRKMREHPSYVAIRYRGIKTNTLSCYRPSRLQFLSTYFWDGLLRIFLCIFAAINYCKFIDNISKARVADQIRVIYLSFSQISDVTADYFRVFQFFSIFFEYLKVVNATLRANIGNNFFRNNFETNGVKCVFNAAYVR